MFRLINLIHRTMIDINANLTKRSRNKKRLEDSREATIITRVIIVVINCLKDFLFYCFRYI